MEESNFNMKNLLKKAMDINWDSSVFEAYESNPSVRQAKVTRTKQTILHLAVSRKDDNAVERLVNAIHVADAFKILTLKNDLGNTPLHVAAELGLNKICWLLAEKCKKLVVSVPNNMGETPLYVAVHHGKKETFFVLQDYVPTSMMSGNFAFCRRGDENTILHAAVHAAYFELAFEIIKLYPRLVNFNNKMGQSPLHLLANKPMVFKSGRPPPGIFKKLLYSCIKVDKLEPKYDQGSHRIRIVGNEPPIFADVRERETTKRKKTMHEHANQVMKELINLSSYWVYGESDKMPNTPDVESSTNNSESLEGENMQIKRQPKDEDKEADKPMRDSPILVAAKGGIVEMVEYILDIYPEAIEDLDSNHKNIILLSAEHRQLNLYKHMMRRRPRRNSIFAVVDKDGNNALHLAAGTAGYNSSWVFRGPAFQMQWEIICYKFVRYSMEPGFFQLCNNNGLTAKEIFSKTHKDLFKDGREWLRNTSQSHSVIATLVATMMYSFTITFSDSGRGFLTLMGDTAFEEFAQAVLMILCISFVTIFVFLYLLTGRFEEWDFEIYVPFWMLIGHVCLQMSIAMLFSSVIALLAVVMDKHISTYAGLGINLFLMMLGLPNYLDMARYSLSKAEIRVMYELRKTAAIIVLQYLLLFVIIVLWSGITSCEGYPFIYSFLFSFDKKLCIRSLFFM